MKTDTTTPDAHTPGPWVLWNNMVCIRDSQHPQPSQPIDIFSADDWVHRLGEYYRPEFIANSRLIAAAPELLAACRAAMAFIETHKAALIGIECTSEEYERAVVPIVAVIKKATEPAPRKKSEIDP